MASTGLKTTRTSDFALFFPLILIVFKSPPDGTKLFLLSVFLGDGLISSRENYPADV